MRKTYFIVLILLIVVLCSCQEPIQEPNNNWEDESILGVKIVNEELKSLLPLLSASGASEIPGEVSVLDLLWYYNCNENNKIIEMTATNYGDFICGYLTNETINKVYNNKDKAIEIEDFNYFNSEGIDDIYSLYMRIKKGDFHREEQVLKDAELILYKNGNDSIVYEEYGKRLVSVWREILLESKDGKQTKVLCDVTGEIIGNKYFISHTLSQNMINGEKIDLGDTFWLRISDYRSIIRCTIYPVFLLEIDKYNELDSIYEKHRVYKTLNSKEKYVSDFEWYDYYSSFIEECFISKEYISEWPVDVENWGYWLDYSKVKETLNVE